MDLKSTWRTSGRPKCHRMPQEAKGCAASLLSQSLEGELDMAPSFNMVDLLNVKLSYERAV
jgi:hypothetical protein